MSIPWLGWSKAPPSLADAFMRDPVGALSPRRPTAAELQRTARRFLADTNVSLAGEGSAGLLLLHASNRHTPSGPPSSYVYWAARTAALYARRHGYAYAFFDTTAALLELGRGATRQFPAEWGVATVLAQFSKPALLLGLALDGAFAQLMFLDDDAGIVAPSRTPALDDLLGGAPSALCARDGVGAADLAGRRTPSGEPVAKALYYDQYHAGAEALRAARPKHVLVASQPNIWDGSLGWCAACAARAATRPIHGWADDCALNSGVVLAGTCAGARRLLEAWLGLAPLGAPLGACSALLRFPGERNRTAATPEWTPLHYCPCTMRCKDGYALNALLEGPHLGEAIVVDDRLVNRPDARYVRHLWCGGYGGRDGCAQKRERLIPEWYDGPRDAEALRAMIPPPVAWRQRQEGCDLQYSSDCIAWRGR